MSLALVGAMMTLTDKLLLTADTYCAHVQRSRSRISTIVFGDGLRLEGIAAGKDIQTRNYEKAMVWFASNWPEALPWPEGVERPLSPSESEHLFGAESVANGAAA